MIRVTQSIYPAVGNTQVAYGRENGIWGAWFVYGGKPNPMMRQSSEEDALALYENLQDVLKFTENLI